MRDDEKNEITKLIDFEISKNRDRMVTLISRIMFGWYCRYCGKELDMLNDEQECNEYCKMRLLK